MAAKRDDTHYALGSVLNHVLLHQTVIGQEAIAQLEQAGDYPDVVVAAPAAARTSPDRLPVHRCGATRRPQGAGGRVRTGGLPVTDARQIRL